MTTPEEGRGAAATLADAVWEAARDAAAGQFGLLVSRIAALGEAELAAPTRLEGWCVRELLAHLTRNVDAVRSGLDAPSPPRAEMDLAGYYDGAAPVAAAVRQRSLDDAAGLSGRALRQRFAATVGQVGARLAAVPGDRVVRVRLGSVRLSDFLVTRCVEGVVHGLDLARAVDADPAGFVHPPAASACVRLLAARAARQGQPVCPPAVTAPVDTAVIRFVEHLTGRATEGDLGALAAVAPVLC
ncbi:maleylpyruvate isomerase N-terminal domain-containing protein [Prauserella muralis]|uniref:Mycothiol-dependent maleylpyruvate isomerase metal-binding domain-containing protein n=1 Tax=Prauserella muralis TaxID=588067 RepID=A0A2V4ANJ0_9PSEU|nr:maleylpyruvate isomerase N-terminal domain-containing protein [Prauserella muralis]PXY22137.1 hypothetical protein BAY60_19750 [Prauserella muralis]TWE27734.1 uncharacterized protein (TIGR03083 family) [Prauserella muralis]